MTKSTMVMLQYVLQNQDPGAYFGNKMKLDTNQNVFSLSYVGLSIDQATNKQAELILQLFYNQEVSNETNARWKL